MKNASCSASVRRVFSLFGSARTASHAASPRGTAKTIVRSAVSGHTTESPSSAVGTGPPSVTSSSGQFAKTSAAWKWTPPALPSVTFFSAALPKNAAL